MTRFLNALGRFLFGTAPRAIIATVLVIFLVRGGVLKSLLAGLVSNDIARAIITVIIIAALACIIRYGVFDRKDN